MKKMLMLVLGIFIVCVPFIFFMNKGPDLSAYNALREPRISTMKDQKMLVVIAQGSPDVTGGKAFGLLFKTYFKIKGAPKGFKQPAPRARWSASLAAPQSEWKGAYALPVPDEVSELPETNPESGMSIGLTTWEYGEIAEILHVGPYDKEEPTIRKLMDFITRQGYETNGEHEEVYLKGPTMFSKGDPEKYFTIIRYRVKKSTSS